MDLFSWTIKILCMCEHFAWRLMWDKSQDLLSSLETSFKGLFKQLNITQGHFELRETIISKDDCFVFLQNLLFQLDTVYCLSRKVLLLQVNHGCESPWECLDNQECPSDYLSFNLVHPLLWSKAGCVYNYFPYNLLKYFCYVSHWNTICMVIGSSLKLEIYASLTPLKCFVLIDPQCWNFT